ncbi:MAG TPA: erythromycin esterase family protein [Thermoanaerobaculia bacterium]
MRIRTVVIVSLWLLVTALSSRAQEKDPRVAWLAANAVPIRSLDVGDDDFSDLEPLRATLKGVRVVMLGEQTHGDGTTFLAKNRLIRFLHEELGFDVLAFESGLYDCAKAWEFLAAGEAPEKAFPRGVFAIWSVSREVQPLVEYLGRRAKSDRPLELAGVDSQLTGSASTELLVTDLAAFLSRIDPKLAKGKEWDRVAGVIGHLTKSSWELGTEPVPSPREQAAFARTIERWRTTIAARDRTPASQAWSGAFWRQLLTNLRLFAEQTWRTDYRDHAGNVPVFAMRDRQMGENLLWLANERYPGRRIIVWGATFHNARNLGTIAPGDAKRTRLYAGTAPMGEVAAKALGERLYSLGFTSYEGEAARAFSKTATPLPPATAGSLEDLFARAGLTNAFLDFRKPSPGGQWLHAPLTARLLGHVEMRADWSRIVDGVVFLRKMERSRKVSAP